MFFVVVLHSLGQGGILKNTIVDSIQYKFSWFLEICAYCAVDIFALISGYVSYNGKEKRINYSRYIDIWLQIVFYGLLVTAFFNIFRPELVSQRDYLLVLFPVTNGLYWYLTAYTGLFVFMPFINKSILECDNKKLKKIFIVILLVFSVFDTISKRFCLENGYSVIWIIILYILGAIIKKCNIGENIKVFQVFIGIIVLSLITWVYKIYGFERNILNIEIKKGLFISYTSPTILGIAILYLIGLPKLKFNILFQKIIKFAASSTFAIYILNNHRLIWNYVMKDRNISIVNESCIKIFASVILFSLVFSFVAILIDKIRIQIFKILHINDICKKIEFLLNSAIIKISEKI